MHCEDGKSYPFTLYNGRLDVGALRTTWADDDLVLKILDGVGPSVDEHGMSRSVFNADIQARIQLKKGDSCPSCSSYAEV